jgi:hypothetical protein
MNPSAIKSNFSQLDQLFIEYGDTLSKYHAENSVNMQSYRDRQIPHFTQLPEELKKLILDSMMENIDLFNEMKSHGESLVDSPKLLWRSLNRLGWKPKSDIFDKMADGDIIEVYTLERMQVFRNLAFFDVVSLTLEELVSFPLGIAYEIENHALDFYVQLSEKAAAQEITNTHLSPLRPYLVKEKLGEKLTVKVTPKWISPVYQNNIVVGIIGTHRSEIIA